MAGSGYELFPKRVVEEDFLEKLFAFADRQRLIGIKRQPQHEGRAMPIFAPRLDAAAMMMDDEVAGHQVEAVFEGAVTANGERVED
jgi:hypothetical protein